MQQQQQQHKHKQLMASNKQAGSMWKPMVCAQGVAKKGFSTSYNPKVSKFDLYCVIDQEQQSTGQFRAALSRGLEHAVVKKFPTQPPTTEETNASPLRSCHYSNPGFLKKNILEGMVRESRVRPPPLLLSPTPAPEKTRASPR